MAGLRIDADQLRNAEVDDFDGQVGKKENVARLEVAVDDAAAVGSHESAGDLVDDVHGLVDAEVPTGAHLLHALVEGLAVEQGHDEKRFARTIWLFQISGIVNIDDIGVAQGAEHAEFALE